MKIFYFRVKTKKYIGDRVAQMFVETALISWNKTDGLYRYNTLNFDWGYYITRILMLQCFMSGWHIIIVYDIEEVIHKRYIYHCCVS